MGNELEIVKRDIQAALTNDYAFLKDTIDAIVITTDDEMRSAGDFRAKVNKFCNAIEEKRKATVDPFNKLVKEINGEYKKASALFDGLLINLDAKVKPYLIEVARKKEEWAKAKREKELAESTARQKELEVLAAETNSPVALEMALIEEEEKHKLEESKVFVYKNIKSEDISTALVDNWKAIVENDALVPRAYCSADASKLKVLVKENLESIKDGTFKIAGVSFINEQRIGSYKR